MKITAILKNVDKNDVLQQCFMGYDYEQVGNDVTILYELKRFAKEDLKDYKGEYELYDGWEFVDLVSGKHKIEY